MTHGRPAGKPSETKREVEGGPKKKTPSALGARRRAGEATELCLALCARGAAAGRRVVPETQAEEETRPGICVPESQVS